MPLWSLPVIAFGVFLIVHVISWRILRERGVIGLWPLCAVALGSYGFVGLPWILVMPELNSDIHWVTLPLFAFLFMGYLYFYYGILRSVSVRLLGELLRCEGGVAPVRTLQRAYSYDTLLAVRVDSLLRAGWAARRDSQLVLLPRGRHVARLAAWLKQLYRLEVSG